MLAQWNRFLRNNLFCFGFLSFILDYVHFIEGNMGIGSELCQNTESGVTQVLENMYVQVVEEFGCCKLLEKRKVMSSFVFM